MKKNVLIVALMLAFLFVQVQAQRNTKNQQPEAKTKTEQPAQVKTEPRPGSVQAPKAEPAMKFNFKGQVVSLNKLVNSQKGEVTVDEATKMAEKGQPIVLLVNKKVHFVYNSDGSFAGMNLAKYAANKTVGIVGRKKTANGLNIIIADMIKPIN